MSRLLAATLVVLSFSQLCVGQQQASQTVSPYVRKAILSLMQKSARETLGAEEAKSMVNELVKGWARQYGANANPSQSLEALRGQLTPQEKMMAIRQLREMANSQVQGAAMMQNVPNAGHDLQYSPYRNRIRQMDYYAKLLNAEIALLAGGRYNPPAGPTVGPAPPPNTPPIGTTPEKQAIDANDSLRKILEGLYQQKPDGPSDRGQQQWELGPGRKPFKTDPPYPETNHYPLDKNDIPPNQEETDGPEPAEPPLSLDPFNDLEDDGSRFQSPSVSELENRLQEGTLDGADFEHRLREHNNKLGAYDPDNPTEQDLQAIEHIQSLSMDERFDYYDELKASEEHFEELRDTGRITEEHYEKYLSRIDRDRALFADATASGALTAPDFDHIDVAEGIFDLATLGGRRVGTEIVEEGAELLGKGLSKKIPRPIDGNLIAKNPITRIVTREGPVLQSNTAAALAARKRVDEGAYLYRMGTTNKSGLTEAQYWALEHPSTPGFANRYGIPPDNISDLNFIERGKLKTGTNYITREAPGVAGNKGGGIEVVVPLNGVSVDFFQTWEK